ncbi:MAG: adenylate/guanylate cyclase domain-containing protein, partial [Ilumatobacteraceae bacterium]
MTVYGADRFVEWLAGMLRSAEPVTPSSERLERLVLGGSRRYSRLDVEARSGVPRERNERLWRALGFADVDDDDVVFTEADVDALKLIDGLVTSGLIAPNVEAAVARAAGQALSRLAEWEIGLLNDFVVPRATNGNVAPDQETVLEFAETILPIMEQLHSYVWRRHVAAVAGRALAASPDELESNTLVVGFADVVGYTRLTRNLPDAELAALIERFESTVADVIAAGAGRVIKMLGDEVLFAASDPAAAAAIALDLLDAIVVDGELPNVRIGMARGNVLSRFGDVYGPVVNVASRLTSAAKPGTILVDEDLASVLAGE